MNTSQFWFSAASGGDLGEPIEQSLRFRNTQRLVSANSRPTGDWTFSFWYKPAVMYKKSSRDSILTFAPNYGYQMGNPLYTGLAPYGCFMTVNSAVSGVVERLTNGSLNDTSAWYHVVLISESLTTRCYVNGVKQAHTADTPEGNSSMTIGSNQTGSQDDALEGYLAEVNMLDGTVVSHTTTDGQDIIDEFGRYNEDGVWVPKKIEFTAAQYGAKGFRLTFDSSQSNATDPIGEDSAPIGSSGHTARNDFTESGFTTTAISTSNFENDVDYKDTPTSNYSVLASNSKKGNGEIVDAGLGFYGDESGQWRSALSSQIIDSGKWYWEVQDNQNEIFVGVADSRYWAEFHSYNTNVPGGDAGNYSIGYYTNNGTKYKEGTTTANYGPSGTAGATYMFAWDADTGTFWAGKNGTWNSSATQSEIEAGTTTNAMYTGVTTGNQYRAIVSHAYTTASDRAKVNFGQRPFQYTQPSGYNALESNNYSEPTIKDGRDYFDVDTYSTGSSGGYTSTKLAFQPDLVWIKRRNGGTDGAIFDSVRGVHKGLIPSDTSTQFNESDTLTAFNSDGFTVSTDDRVGSNNNTYVAWCWKAGTSYTPTVTGYTSPSASINKKAGFGIYKVTGNNTASSFTHGLDARPQIIIAKNLTTLENWAVIGPTNDARAELAPNVYLHRMDLNDRVTKASNVLNGISDTTLTFNSYAEVAGDDDYVFYCWHSVEGYSKIGSYRGTGNANGAYVPCGFKPAFVMIKCINQDGDWNMYDSTRNPDNPVDDIFRANLNDSEDLTNDAQSIELLSNGFKCKGANSNINETYYYMYMAFAEHPAGGENTPPATAR